ncbi:SCO family protein [Sedimenticola selenatireducens]|uniref:SCO family protein n=1 Tax=Sedimenticola selenatireducens TaxID=191960 RepID=A0A557S4W9_9GAMM|nr:SCO family protein [Sedimenticola selenatireducens]TVO72460.1 SCO family protein [Sedimenticola selenatireducens]TVT64715.1 MAG: SCO family protein [Sedimenticola selenatireducens]
MKKVMLFGLVVVLGSLLMGVLFLWQPSINTSPSSSIASLGIAEAPKGGDFVLNAQGGAVDLKSLRGQVVVIYFGYTWCPDICPTSLGFLSAALDELTDDELRQVQGIFISVDPERDSLEHLKSYGEYFHRKILGVTGSDEQLKRVADLYGAAYRLVKNDSSTDYVVDHSADLYVVNQQGQLATTLRHGTLPQQIVTVLRGLINNN